MARLLAVGSTDPIFDRRILVPGRPAKKADPDEGSEGISEVAQPFVGEYRWNEDASGNVLDFQEVTLRADGTYAGKVEATLVNPSIRTFAGRCFLPEEGVWNAYTVSGQLRIRIRPTTSKARVYAAAISEGRFTISRRGEKTTLIGIGVVGAPAASVIEADDEEDAREVHRENEVSTAQIPDDVPTQRNLCA